MQRGQHPVRDRRGVVDPGKSTGQSAIRPRDSPTRNAVPNTAFPAVPPSSTMPRRSHQAELGDQPRTARGHVHPARGLVDPPLAARARPAEVLDDIGEEHRLGRHAGVGEGAVQQLVRPAPRRARPRGPRRRPAAPPRASATRPADPVPGPRGWRRGRAHSPGTPRSRRATLRWTRRRAPTSGHPGDPCSCASSPRAFDRVEPWLPVPTTSVAMPVTAGAGSPVPEIHPDGRARRGTGWLACRARPMTMGRCGSG